MRNVNVAFCIALAFVLTMLAMVMNKDYNPYKPCEGLQGAEVKECQAKIDAATSGAGW